VIDELMLAVKLAFDCGAECVTFDAEAACKLNSLVTHKISTRLLRVCRERVPDDGVRPHGLRPPNAPRRRRRRQYDDGAVRGEYDWRGWVGDEGADLEEWQNYVAPAEGIAPRGAIFARVRSSNASVRTAVSKGWVRDDLQLVRYFQLHHTGFVEIASASVLAPIVKGWCGPFIPRGRMDESGAWGFRAMCVLERAGIRLAGGIEAFQCEHGLNVDGRAGRQTLALLGLDVPKEIA
jgi:hypothetical protein